MANFIGFDGNASVGTMDCVQIKTWSANITRTVHDVGGFGQSGRYRRPGKYDIQGSFGGVGKHGSTNPIGLLVAGAAVSVVLTMYDGTGTSDSALTFDALVTDPSLGSTHDGDMTVTANLQLSSTAVSTSTPFTIAWLTS